MKDMIVVVWFVGFNKGNVFVFSKLIITKNENNGKVNRKVFLIVKSGLSHKRFGGHRIIPLT
jgi:hypothetical protein